MTRSEQQSSLSDVNVTYFDGVNNGGGFLGVKTFTISSSTTNNTPMFVTGNNSHALNAPDNSGSFNPTHQIFISPTNSIQSALIPATDGVYCNSLFMDESQKLSNWSRLNTPSGMSDAFADWIVETGDDNNKSLYGFKTNSSNILVTKNTPVPRIEIKHDEDDIYNVISKKFHDLTEEQNSFFFMDNGALLSCNRNRLNETDITGNISNLDVENVVRIGDVFYAVQSVTDNLSAVCSASADALPWKVRFNETNSYNILKQLESTHAADWSAFLKNANSSILYNEKQKTLRWNAVKNAAVYVNRSNQPISGRRVIDYFDSVETFDVNENSISNSRYKVGLRPKDLSQIPGILSSTASPACSCHCLSNDTSVMVSLFVYQYGYGRDKEMFDLRGSISAYIENTSQMYWHRIDIGNAYTSTTYRGVVVEFPGIPGRLEMNEIEPNVCQYYIGEHSDYEWPNAFVNGPAVQLAYPDGAGEHQFAVVPLVSTADRSISYYNTILSADDTINLSANTPYVFVYDYITQSDGTFRKYYNWNKPSIIIDFRDSENNLISNEKLIVRDIFVDKNHRIYVSTVNPNRANERIDYRSSAIGLRDGNNNTLFYQTNSFHQVKCSYSINNIVKSPTSNAAFVDIYLNDFHNPVLLDSSGVWSTPFANPPSAEDNVEIPWWTMHKYAQKYGADATLLQSADKIIGDFQSKLTESYEIIQDTQLKLPSVKCITSTGKTIWTFNFDGTSGFEPAPNDIKYSGSNSLVVSFEPTVLSAYSPANFGLRSLYSNNRANDLIGIYVLELPNMVNSDGYFYALVEDVSVSDNQTTFTNKRYGLFKCNKTTYKIEELSDRSIRYDANDGLYGLIGPDSWKFLNTAGSLWPNKLIFTNGSLIKITEYNFDINSWTKLSNPINVSGGVGRYVTFSNGKVLTWDDGKKIHLLDMNSDNPSVSTFDASAVVGGRQIVGVQNMNNETVYVFASSPSSARNAGTTVDITVYRGAYSGFSSNWTLNEYTTIRDVHFLNNGTMYLVVSPETSEIEEFIYSSSSGGIETIEKMKYSLGHEIEPSLSSINFSGTVFKESGDSFLANSGASLYEIVNSQNNLNAVEVLSLSGLNNAWLNYKNSDSTSYAATDNGNHLVLKIDGDTYTGIKTQTKLEPRIYDVYFDSEFAVSSNINFRSTNGVTYYISSVTAEVPSAATEVYNGKMLLSNMIRKFVTKDEIKDAEETHVDVLSVGNLMDFHIPYFTVDVDSVSPSVYIDTMYNTVQLTDDFDQTYWIVQLQLDNIVSSLANNGDVLRTHIPQRIKLGEPYDKPLKFKTVYNGGTSSALVILTTQDRPVVYKTENRLDWDKTHLRKVVREIAHIDNVADAIDVNPDFVEILNDIPTSLNTNVMLLNGGDVIAVYNGWRRDIPYFGSCISPYTLFNSRLQEVIVPVISKYGEGDVNFVLGTNEGFIHLLNGRLFAKAMYVDEDENKFVLSGDCTYAGCHQISNGTSIYNRFMFANGHGLYHINEHDFEAERDVGDLFVRTGETVNDVLRIGDGSYVICTNKGIYTAQPKILISDYLDDYVLSDLNNAVDLEFARLLTEHRNARHFAGSDMDIINKKIDVNFNPYPTGFTDVSPVVTSRHVLNVDNDLVDTMEIRLTDAQAANNSSNVFAAIKNNVITGIAAGTRSYAPAGWYDRVVDPNDENHVVDYSDIRYICRKWHSGIVEFYIYVPTTFTYYMNNLAGYSQSPYTGLELIRPNIQNIQLANDVNKQCTHLRLYINNSLYKLNSIYTVEIVGNSLPLKVYMDSTYCDSNKAGLFDTLVEPSVVRSLPLITGRSRNNVNPLLNASNQICLEFAVYGSDAQAIHIMAR